MRRDGNIEEWLAGAPAEVVATTRRLLDEVCLMRAGETIYPPQDDILNALAFTGPRDVRAVILGQDPYHEPGQAMGLSFSVPFGQKLPPSLRNIFKELAADLCCPAPQSGDLTPWAEQGVLLLNATLTVREHAANSHSRLGWQTLTNHIVRTCLALPQPVVFLAWGRPAIKLIEDAEARLAAEPGLTAKSESVAGPIHDKFVLRSTHPSPLSANRASGDLPAFMGSRPFSRANRILAEHGAGPIDWTRVG